MSAALQGIRPSGNTHGGHGCYKCGKSGHWARDCTAPLGDQLNRLHEAQPAASSAGPQPLHSAENHPNAVREAPPVVAAATKRAPRPKMTLELLQKDGGLNDVYYNFPSIFAQSYKGRGHEASDLRRLLEMYKRWQDRLFPHCEFDTFIAKVGELSHTSRLKHELQEKRANIIRLAQDALHIRQEKDIENRIGKGISTIEDDDDDIELAIEMDDDEERIAMEMDRQQSMLDNQPPTEDDDFSELHLGVDDEDEEGGDVVMGTQELIEAAFTEADKDELNDDQLLEMALANC